MMEFTGIVVKKGLEMGATDVIAKGKTSRNQQVRFSNNQIDVAMTWYERVLQIFLVHEKRIVTTEIRNFNNIDETLKNLISLAKISQENPEYQGIAEGPFTYTAVRNDPALKNLTDVSDFVTAAINKAVEKATTTAGILHVTDEESFLSSSGGIEVQDEVTSIELSIRAFIKEASGHSVSCSPTLDKFAPEKAGEEAGELAHMARNPVPGDEGLFDVVMAPLFFGSVLSYSMDMTSIFNVLSGRSMYGEKLGQKVASEKVTVKDTPSGMNQARFNDEGFPTRENIIIEKGILKTYLHNTSTAQKAQSQVRGNTGLVVPRPLNISMDPGTSHKEELFREVKNGIFLTNTWYTRFQNMQTGDFSTMPRDAILKIENGEITGSLNNVRVSDNMLNLYQNIEAVSKEQKLVHWWIEVEFPCTTPYVLARKVRITRPTQ